MRLLITLFISLTSCIAAADEFHELVRYSCDTNHDSIVIEYLGAYNEEGEALNRNAGKDDWPRPPSRATGLGDASPLVRHCQLSNGQYTYEVKGVPEGQTNFMGRCGAWSSAKVRIVKGQQVIVEQQLDDNCYHPDAPVITKIVVNAKNNTPTITKLLPDAFFK